MYKLTAFYYAEFISACKIYFCKTLEFTLWSMGDYKLHYKPIYLQDFFFKLGIDVYVSPRDGTRWDMPDANREARILSISSVVLYIFWFSCNFRLGFEGWSLVCVLGFRKWSVVKIGFFTWPSLRLSNVEGDLADRFPFFTVKDSTSRVHASLEAWLVGVKTDSRESIVSIDSTDVERVLVMSDVFKQVALDGSKEYIDSRESSKTILCRDLNLICWG